MASGQVEDIKDTLKRAAGALRDADVPFLVAGTMASWARGGPESGHDVDFVVKPEDAERALEVLAEAGMRTERPPEGWLYKAWDGDVLIDLIFSPSGIAVDDAVLERGDDINVMATSMRVMSLEDLLVTKLSCLREHVVDYESVLEITRALREQIDWDAVRERAPDNPYVRAFFTLVEGLGLVEPSTAAAN